MMRVSLSRTMLRAAAVCALLCASVGAGFAQSGASGFAEVNGTRLY